MITLIKSVGKRELMREARIAMRTIDAVWDGEEVADEDPKRMAAAAERIVELKKKREDEQAAAIVWLKAKRAGIGLSALAKMLGVDAVNLGKVLDRVRRPSRDLLMKIASVSQMSE